MKRVLALLSILVLPLAISGCLKQNATLVINNDATATMSLEAGYSVDSLESMAEFLEGIMEQAGEEIEENPLEALEELEKQFTETKLVAQLKKTGVEVTSSKTTEKDGWKMVAAQGRIKDVNTWVTAAGKAAESSGSANEATPVPVRGMASKLLAVSFYKTDKPGVGEVEIMPPMDDFDPSAFGAAGGMDPSEIPEGSEEMVEAQIDMMKERFGVNDLNLAMKLTLPGKILTTKGCKVDKQDPKRVNFAFKGANISLSGLQTFWGMKDGISATFEIPKDCKLKFVEKKAKKATAKKAEKKDAKKDKKGGLTIKDGDKDR